MFKRSNMEDAREDRAPEIALSDEEACIVAEQEGPKSINSGIEVKLEGEGRSDMRFCGRCSGIIGVRTMQICTSAQNHSIRGSCSSSILLPLYNQLLQSCKSVSPTSSAFLHQINQHSKTFAALQLLFTLTPTHGISSTVAKRYTACFLSRVNS